MKIIYILLGICMLFLTACQQETAEIGKKAIFAYSRQLERHYPIKLQAWGGSFGDHINNFDVSYKSSERVQLEQARKLFVSAVENFLQQVNLDIEIRSFLIHYPLTYCDVEFEIHFHPRHRTSQDVFHVFMFEGEIFYSCKDTKTDKVTTFHTESYPNALKIVREIPPVNTARMTYTLE